MYTDYLQSFPSSFHSLSISNFHLSFITMTQKTRKYLQDSVKWLCNVPYLWQDSFCMMSLTSSVNQKNLELFVLICSKRTNQNYIKYFWKFFVKNLQSLTPKLLFKMSLILYLFPNISQLVCLYFHKLREIKINCWHK